MPGENCAIPGCSISGKDKGISIFKVPLANNEFNEKWSQDLINIILKYQQRDKSLNKRLESHKLFICEKHFTADQIYVYPSRKSLKEGTLPTLSLPRPSVNATNNHSTRAIEKREEYSFLQAQLPQPQQKCQKSKMFISWQSYEGLQITVFSFKEVCKFLLQQGIPYILSERFFQDDLENYFGKQRAIGRRCDNPTVRDFSYNDNTIKSQFSARPIAGNVQGPVGKFTRISEEPLPKIKKNALP